MRSNPGRFQDGGHPVSGTRRYSPFVKFVKEGVLEAVDGRVVRVLFQNPDSLWAALRVERKDDGETITVVGEFISVAPDDRFLFRGEWVRHPKWGLQLKATTAERVQPHTSEAIIAFLSGGLFPGIGLKLARRLVGAFGSNTLEILDKNPEALEKVRGISAKRRERVLQAFSEHRSLQQLALFLQGHGVSLAIVRKLAACYGPAALDVVKSDPYRAAGDVDGIGFLRADEIARKTGLPLDSPVRVEAAVRYVLEHRCETGGHSYLPEGELVGAVLQYLNRDSSCVHHVNVKDALERLVESGRLVREEPDALFLDWVRDAEDRVAARLSELNSTPHPAARPARKEPHEWSKDIEDIEYSPEQEEAIRQALTRPVSIVTGGPGTGKSTIIRAVIAALERMLGEPQVLLAAPTGRAAKRLSELSGCDAVTIHRLLEFSGDGGTFSRDEGNPLEGDLLVVDEASMVDLPLADALLRAVPDDMRLLFVGDADQLPSVGFGNVFADLIGSGCLPVVRLRQIFRQAAESRIVVNAHRVNQGQMPLLDDAPDFHYEPADDPLAVAAYIRAQALACRRAGMGLDEITVLTPMRKTETGVINLNRELQDALNPAKPGKPELKASETVFREGDKVMQIRNNYEAGVFNGDAGVIVRMQLDTGQESGDGEDDEEGDVIHVDYPSGRVVYGRDDLDQLVLAYATTIHKSQGSEYDGTVYIPVMRQHWRMLQRNLLYTAITRAKKRVVLAGQLSAIRQAVENVSGSRRYSRLAERLREAASAVEVRRQQRRRACPAVAGDRVPGAAVVEPASPASVQVPSAPAGRPSKAGKPWTPAEDSLLRTEFETEKSVDVLSALHERTQGAITARLVRLGLLAPGISPALSE